MYKRKSSLFIVAVLLLSMVLTGCNANTLGFINHVGEVQAVMANNPTQTISKITINDIKVPAEILGTEEKAILATVNKFLGNSYITIVQNSNPEKNITSTAINLVEKKTNKNDNLITLKYKDEAIAFSVGPKLNEIYPGIDVVLAPINNKLIPLSMFQEYFGDTVLNMISNPKSLDKLEKKSETFLKELMAIYKNTDTNLITKEGNAFVLQVDTKDFIELMDTFVTVTLANFDSVLACTISFMDSLTTEEFNMMYGTTFSEGKVEIIKMLNDAKKEFAEEGLADELLLMWNMMFPEMADMMSTMFEGSSVRMRTWKENNSFYTNLSTVMKMTDPDDPGVVLGATILIEEETKISTEDFEVTMPTEKINKELIESLLDYM